MTLPVIYIAGCNYSGSTILELMLDSHSQLCGLGEIHRLQDFLAPPEQWRATRENPTPACTCGSLPLCGCPFWSQVFSQAPPSPDAFRTDGAHQGRLNASELAVLRAAMDVSGAQALVVGSKYPYYLWRFGVTPDIRLHVIHLIKPIRDYCQSVVKRGSRHYQAYRDWRRINRQCESQGQNATSYHRISWTTVLENPTEALQRLLSPLQLSLESNMLDFHQNPHHGIGGNHARRAGQGLAAQPRPPERRAADLLFYPLLGGRQESRLLQERLVWPQGGQDHDRPFAPKHRK